MTYSNMLLIGAGLAVSVGGIGFQASPAFAKNSVVVTAPDRATLVQRRISYADLNLASSTGERSLNRRVDGAVSSLCDEASGYDRTPLSPALRWRGKCVSTAHDQARPQIASAVQRARDIALTGTSPIAAVAITIALPQ
jgi:UrcA family protein